MSFVLRPYLALIRWHKPIGTFLVLWPALWLLLVLTGASPPLSWVLALVLGAFLMRSSGCMINDMTDRKLDAQVARTASRPLASGALSMWQSGIFLALLLTAAAILAYRLSPLMLAYAFAAIPLIVAYPWMKRITWWPQLFLGITFNYGVLLTSVWVAGSIQPVALWLWASAVFWTLGYDTIYGFQDIEDDQKIGVKSTARLFARQPKPILALCYTLTVVCFATGLAVHDAAFLTYLSAVCMAVHFAWQIITLDTANPANCARRFTSNGWLGAWVSIVLLAGESLRF